MTRKSSRKGKVCLPDSVIVCMIIHPLDTKALTVGNRHIVLIPLHLDSKLTPWYSFQAFYALGVLFCVIGGPCKRYAVTLTRMQYLIPACEYPREVTVTEWYHSIFTMIVSSICFHKRNNSIIVSSVRFYKRIQSCSKSWQCAVAAQINVLWLSPFAF